MGVVRLLYGNGQCRACPVPESTLRSDGFSPCLNYPVCLLISFSHWHSTHNALFDYWLLARLFLSCSEVCRLTISTHAESDTHGTITGRHVILPSPANFYRRRRRRRRLSMTSCLDGGKMRCPAHQPIKENKMK